jgi:cephalosporin hydroxylase
MIPKDKDLVFRLGPRKESDEDCFHIIKPMRMQEQYECFWSCRQFRPKNILELGIYEGGSIVMWYEQFKPDLFVAIDFSKQSDSDYFNRWKVSRNARVKTYWDTNQTDTVKLGKIVEEDFGGKIDLIIDDASHLYQETKTSFEFLFPLLQPGGLYIIEDWSWGLWPKLPQDFRPHGTEPHHLIFELVEATGSITRTMVNGEYLPPIKNMEIFADFAVLERGSGELQSFSLDSYITRRPNANE